jgi:hypothetical protein
MLTTTLNNISNHTFGVMISMLTLSVVDRGLKPLSGQTENNEFGICCFSGKQVALRSKSKDRCAWNQKNVSK